MRPEDLVEALAADAKPVQPLAPPMMVLVWQFGSAAIPAGLGALTGRHILPWPQPQIGTQLAHDRQASHPHERRVCTVTLTQPLRTPLLVFGGPYSNLRALAALRVQAAALGIDAARAVCTGDIVAYCAEPEETVAAIREWGCRVVAGNCEEQLALGADDCGCGFEQGSTCNQLAKDWYTFARRNTSAASRAWMSGLPKTLAFTVGGRAVRVIHGGVDRINRFVFASQRQHIAEELEKAKVDIVVAGHAGVPFIEQVGQQVWFNPGVIGMPANDGTPDVWYGLVESRGDELILSTRRLAYDHQGAVTAMQRAGHADGYARALRTGLWPSVDVLPRRERAASGERIKERTARVPMRKPEQAATPGAGGCSSIRPRARQSLA